MNISYPEKVRRNDYVYVRATFTEEESENPAKAWDDFSNATWAVMGVRCTQDNTIGQIAETHRIQEHNWCEGGFNLWGLRVTEINARIKEARAE